VRKIFILIIFLFIPHILFATEKTTVYAGGCFWCMVGVYESLPGVTKVVSGYSGGNTKNPTYEQVTYGNTGHLEAVQITYDPDKVSYLTLLQNYWKNIDPYDDRGQFCDKGNNYLSAIFYNDFEEKKIIELSITELKNINTSNIKTKILPYKNFYVAEEYHQNFHTKNPEHYSAYAYQCGRAKKLQSIWGANNIK